MTSVLTVVDVEGQTFKLQYFYLHKPLDSNDERNEQGKSQACSALGFI